jgi:hypothetical protein
MTNWYYIVLDKECGPVSANELRVRAKRGEIQIDTPVRRGQDTRWVTARKVRGLFDDPVSVLGNNETIKGVQANGLSNGSQPSLPPEVVASQATSATVSYYDKLRRHLSRFVETVKTHTRITFVILGASILLVVGLILAKALPSESTVVALSKSLSDESWDIRDISVHKLKEIGPSAHAALPALLSLLDECRKEEQKRAEQLKGTKAFHELEDSQDNALDAMQDIDREYHRIKGGAVDRELQDSKPKTAEQRAKDKEVEEFGVRDLAESTARRERVEEAISVIRGK